MNGRIARLLRDCAEKVYAEKDGHAHYRRLKREWISTDHRKKGRLRRRLERGLFLMIEGDNSAPRCRARFRAAEKKRAAKRKARERKRGER